MTMFYNLAGLEAFDIEAPELSTLLTKPLPVNDGGVCHGGGPKIESSNEQTARDYLYWLQYYGACYRGEDPSTIPVPDDGDFMPEVEIQFPRNNQVFHTTQRIEFKGRGQDPQDGRLTGDALMWRSNLMDGPVGTGDEFFNRRLPVGSHTITLSGTDSDSNESTATINIEVVP